MCLTYFKVVIAKEMNLFLGPIILATYYLATYYLLLTNIILATIPSELISEERAVITEVAEVVFGSWAIKSGSYFRVSRLVRMKTVRI